MINALDKSDFSHKQLEPRAFFMVADAFERDFMKTITKVTKCDRGRSSRFGYK